MKKTFILTLTLISTIAPAIASIPFSAYMREQVASQIATAISSKIDTTATIQAVDTLVKKEVEYEFPITVDLYPKTNSDIIGPEFLTEFNFNISASGEFKVDWGDGTVQTIVKNNTTETNYSHNYVKS